MEAGQESDLSVISEKVLKEHGDLLEKHIATVYSDERTSEPIAPSMREDSSPATIVEEVS